MIVKIYTTITCPYCKVTRSLQSRDVLQKVYFNYERGPMW